MTPETEALLALFEVISLQLDARAGIELTEANIALLRRPFDMEQVFEDFCEQFKRGRHGSGRVVHITVISRAATATAMPSYEYGTVRYASLFDLFGDPSTKPKLDQHDPDPTRLYRCHTRGCLPKSHPRAVLQLRPLFLRLPHETLSPSAEIFFDDRTFFVREIENNDGVYLMINGFPLRDLHKGSGSYKLYSGDVLQFWVNWGEGNGRVYTSARVRVDMPDADAQCRAFEYDISRLERALYPAK